MKKRLISASLIAAAVILGVALGDWYALRGRPPAFCEVSGRPIHSNMLTVVEVNGKRLYTCCPRCPLTLVRQAHAQVKLLEVTDYPSGRRLKARDAYFVNGSMVEMCSAPRMLSDESGTPYVREFDRCSPSVLAFAREDEARAFLAHNGGTLARMDDLMREAGAPPAEGK
jgi:hypothetical protein